MSDIPLDLADALEEDGFGFSDRWHTWGKTCKNGCHDYKDEDGYWRHIPTLPELIEYVDGAAKLNVLTRAYGQRALFKLRNTPPGNFPKRRRRPHGPTTVVLFLKT